MGNTGRVGLRDVQRLPWPSSRLYVAQTLQKARASRIVTTPRLRPGASTAVDPRANDHWPAPPAEPPTTIGPRTPIMRGCGEKTVILERTLKGVCRRPNG